MAAVTWSLSAGEGKWTGVPIVGGSFDMVWFVVENALIDVRMNACVLSATIRRSWKCGRVRGRLGCVSVGIDNREAKAMRGDFDEDEDPDFEPDEGDCEHCGGEGWIMVCIDDICHGLGYCIHGDGDRMCSCNDGDQCAPANAPADWPFRR